MIWLSTQVSWTMNSKLKRNWHWETTPTIEICPDSNISIYQVVDALEYWIGQGVAVPIQGVHKVQHCNPKKKNVIQVNAHIDFDRTQYNAVTDIKWYNYGQKNDQTIYYIDHCQIQLPNDRLGEIEIVWHEFEHALGLGHSRHEIMQKVY